MKQKLLFLSFLLSATWGWGQTTIFTETMGPAPGATTQTSVYESANSFDNDGYTMSGNSDLRNTLPSSGYTGASGGANVLVSNSGTNNFQIAGIDTSNYTNLTLTFGQYKSTTAASNELVVDVSSDGTTYTPLVYSRAAGAGTAVWLLISPTGTIPSAANLRIRFRNPVTTHQYRIDDIVLKGDLIPVINLAPTTLSGFTYTEGSGPSGQQTFTASGVNLTNDVSISAPADFEISTTSGAGFGSSVTLTQTAGSVASTTIYVRLKAGLSAGSYSSEAITASSTGAVSKTVNCSGLVNPVNDLCANAIPLTINAGAVNGTLSGGTGSAGLTYLPARPDVWYSFTATCTGKYLVDVANFAGDIDVDVFAGPSCPTSGVTIASLGHGLQTNTFPFSCTAGTTYYIRVVSNIASSDTNSFTIAIKTVALEVFNTGAPALGSIIAGTNDVVYFGFEIRANPCMYSTYDFTGIKLNKAGSSTAADLSNFRIFYDADGDGTINNGESSVSGAGIPMASPLIFTLTGQTGLTATRKYLVVADVAITATAANTISSSIPSVPFTTTAIAPGGVLIFSPYNGSILGDTQIIIAQEINLKGNSVSIVDGDSTPDVTDHTDFGSIDYTSGTITRTFTIENFGPAATTLNIGAITIGGANAGDFTVSALPAATVAGGASTTFQITFDPSNTGLRTATVSIANNDKNENPYDFTIQGTGICGATTIWDGTAWSNGAPTSGNSVIINGNYDTTINGGDIEACSLVVNPSFTVTITANHYLTIQNGLTVDGTLNIQNNGSLVQVNDAGVNTGNINMERTANLRLWDYVYWSSPVVNFGVSSVSPGTPSNYIFKWLPTVGSNYGSWAAANETMVRGKGYIVRGPSSFNNAAPQNYTVTFIGVPHNGAFTTPIERGDYTGADYVNPSSGTTVTKYDDNWNLIGNPYASSISALDFLTENTNIDGFVNLWTHGTLPNAATANPFYSNFTYNYSPSDYITYNGTGTTSGPAGFNGYIAAGQGFFVNMNDGAATTSTVNFKNSMRSKAYDNSQFYKTAISGKEVDTNANAQEKNRIWVDLISATNTINRTLVGYVTGATMQRDRMFDAVTKVENTQNFYSVMGNDSYVIQGRSLPFDVNDKVQLGVKLLTSGNYTIALSATDGLFAQSIYNIYLEDKLLNIIHDLKQAPYVFTSNAGRIDNRFELRYINQTLSTTDFNAVQNGVLIYANEFIHVTSSLERIKDVIVYDILGRTIAEKKAVSGNSVSLTNLRATQNALIVKVILENDQIVKKKVIY